MLPGCALNQSPVTIDSQPPLLLKAARLFDGTRLLSEMEILVIGNRITRVDRSGSTTLGGARIIDLGDATLLPGLIELHAHLTYRHVPADIVLSHGITTLRDVGGPLHKSYGGEGSLRILTSGPILTAPGGYPIPLLGEKDIAIPIASEQIARDTVQRLAKGGAVIIKIALEPGGEPGAPWSNSFHSHHHEHAVHTDASQMLPWPLLPVGIVKTIVSEAHRLGLKVTAHLGEQRGAEIALQAGVDEWAHVPCAVIPEPLLKQAVAQHVKIVTTTDTLDKCLGIVPNAKALAAAGAEFFYGAEIAHPDIPWGIDAQELLNLTQLAGMSPVQALQTATAKAGAYLNIPKLGTLQSGAPADIIAVAGNPLENFKTLEYPILVMSGGKIVLNRTRSFQPDADQLR